MHEHGYDDVELRFDIWRSMNSRFNQRQIDPRVDLLSPDLKWSPWENTPWLLPLLTNLSDWRTRMNEIEQQLEKNNQNALVTFVADFPGIFLPIFKRNSDMSFFYSRLAFGKLYSA